jgi:hypothetical protein
MKNKIFKNFLAIFLNLFFKNQNIETIKFYNHDGKLIKIYKKNI